VKTQLVAELIRSHEGWTATIEADADAGDHGGWRADVLASGPEGRRIAFEIQLAPMTAAVGRERAARHGRDRVESIWLTPDNPQRAMKIPTLAVSSLKPDAGLLSSGYRRLKELPSDGRRGSRGSARQTIFYCGCERFEHPG
jgi:hypothetical protein